MIERARHSRFVGGLDRGYYGQPVRLRPSPVLWLKTLLTRVCRIDRNSKMESAQGGINVVLTIYHRGLYHAVHFSKVN